MFSLGHRHVVSTISPASEYFRELPHWVEKNLSGLRRICVLFSSKGTFASQAAWGVAETAGAAGFDPVELVPFKSPVSDAAFFDELRSIGPEVLVLAGSFQDEMLIIEARHLWPPTVRLVAAVAAGVQAFYQQLNQSAEGVIGPSQWEPDVRFDLIRGPNSNWFVQHFKERFGRIPDYTAAGGFAIGLVLVECIRLAGSLDDQRVREAAARVDFNTFYGKFRIHPRTGRQVGHRILLVQWQQGRKVLLT